MSKHNSGVYVVQLKQDDKFYVGKSCDIERRIAQHSNIADEKGSAFCKLHGGVLRRVPTVTRECTPHVLWEFHETLTQMTLRGFNNVRGWEFCSSKNLTKDDAKYIKRLLFGLMDVCRKCGYAGHVQKGCVRTHWSMHAPWLREIDALIKPTSRRGAKRKLEE